MKYPFKFSEKDHQWANRTAEFIDRLSVENIEVVGILQPPPADQQNLDDGDGLIIAAMFAQPGVWQPIVDPIMSRLSLKVRWWQLGSDQDTSFVGYPELVKRITEIKDHLELFGLKVKLGFAWQWLQKSPELKNPPWEFLSYTVDPPFTQPELEAYLDGNRAESGRTWVSLRPLSNTKYDLQARVLDLVQRILATKAKNADAVFLTEPFSVERGVMQPDGTPGELLLPWRTATTLLSGTKFEGSIVLPGGSRNYIFSRAAESIMVIWHDQPKREVVFLGHNTKVIDVWGRESKPQQEGHRQVIHVDRFPKFITGVNTAVAKWRMSFQFDRTELASVFGRPQTAAFQLKNAFSQGVNGTMTLNTPPNWDAKSQFPIKLSGGREHREFFPITLRSLASTGKQQLRVDFAITADREYQFSVYREMQVGLGDVVIELDTKLDEQGNLIVKQTLINNTQQFVSFDCSLYMHSRRRKRAYVLNVGEGRHTRIYFYPNGAELVGKPVRLRAREISGQRILNYQTLVEQ
ncbi:MAG: hypothetical protein IH991_23855 [Planctomycetes bacterium]|nr:hypothetical protein [Planctomycetota bacterium]